MIKDILLKLVGDISYSKYFSVLIDLLGKCLWPLTIFVLALLFRQQISNLIDRIRSIEAGNGKVTFASEDLSKITSSRADNPSSNTLAKLASLLFNFQFVWSAWTTSDKFSHAFRFSESYSGGQIRYIDEYVHDLDSFKKAYSTYLPENIKAPLDKLETYLKGVCTYHVKGQNLSGPAFSLPEYLELFRSVVKAVKETLLIKG